MSLSKRKKRKRIRPPRAKRMNRSARLQSARSWLPKFDGKNVLKGYCNHFGVDWRCAAVELQQLGVKLDAGYLKQRENSEQQEIAKRQARKKTQAETECVFDDSYGSSFEAYLAEDYPAMFAMECERDGIELD